MLWKRPRDEALCSWHSFNRIIVQRQAYSDNYIGPTPPCRDRQTLFQRHSLWRRALSDRKCSLPFRRTERFHVDYPNPVANCCLHSCPPRGQANAGNHNYRNISSTECRRQVNQLPVVADGQHDPNIPACSGGAAAAVAETRSNRPHCAACGDTPAGTIRAKSIRRAVFLNHRAYPNRASELSCRTAIRWRFLRAVCPRRCWRRPGPPIPAPSLARDGRSGPSSGSCCDPAAYRSWGC